MAVLKLQSKFFYDIINQIYAILQEEVKIMNLKSCNNVETNRYELEVQVDEKTFNDALNRTYHKEIKKISLPGFRKGKAPRAFVEKYYGEQVFYEGAVNDVFPIALNEAIKESK